MQKFSHVFILNAKVPAQSALPSEIGGGLISPSRETNDEEQSLTMVSNFCNLELIDVDTNKVLQTVRCHEENKGENLPMVLLDNYSAFSDKDKKEITATLLKIIRNQLKETLASLAL